VVTHCICARRSFSDVLALARHAGWQEVDEVQAATGCGARCGLCRPYLGAMLATGQTQFAPLGPGAAPARGERRARH
jgi:bacterioferritin-associated ferredoxin